MFNIIKQQKKIFNSFLMLKFEQDGLFEHHPYLNREKKLDKEKMRGIKSLEEMVSFINSNEMDLKDDEQKEFVKKFLFEISKKNGQSGIQEDDVNSSIWSRERRAFNKVISLIKTLEKYENVESKSRGYTKAELDMLNEFVGQTIIKKSGEEMKELSNEIDTNNPEHVYKFLFDFNGDNIVNKEDKNILNNDSILTYVEKMVQDGKESQLLSSISHILGEKISSREDLHNLLKNAPEKKQKFLDNLTILSKVAFVTDILEYGIDATKKSLEKKQNVDKYIDSLFEEKRKDFDRNYDKAISDFENKLSLEDREKYDELLKKLHSQEVKKSIFENVKLNGVGALVSLVKTREGVGAGASFSNVEIDKQLRKNVSNIISGIDLNIGIASIGGHFMPGIGLNMNFEKTLGENIKGYASAGVFNFVPFVISGFNIQTNKEELIKSGFIDIDKKAKFMGLVVNVSTFGWGIGTGYSENRLERINEQEKKFSKFLNKVITHNGIKKEIIVRQKDYNDYKEEYEKLSSTLEDIFRIIGFDNLSIEQKMLIVDDIKEGYLNQWKQGVLRKVQEKGWEWSGIGAGIQFILGFFPIGLLGVRFSKTELGYEEDKISKNYAILSEVVKISKNDGKKEVPLAKSSLETNPFEKNIHLFEGIARRHKRDWPALIERSPTFDEKLENILKILKTDINRNKKVFKDLVKEIERLRRSSNLEDKDKLNGRIAQFFDIAFKDKRDIEEIIMGYTKEDGKRYNFIEGRYSAVSRFSLKEGLSHDFAGFTRGLYTDLQEKYRGKLKEMKSGEFKIPQVKKSNLYGFVGSYKLDVSGKRRLATGFVDIPAGQTTVVGGLEKPVFEKKDKEWVTDKFLGSEYGKKTMEQVMNLLGEKGLEIDKNEFRELLLSGSIDKNGKKVKLDRDFVYFLYGRCANESIGIRFNSLELDGFDKVDFGDIGPDGILRIKANSVNNVFGDNKDFSLGIMAGDGPKPKDEEGIVVEEEKSEEEPKNQNPPENPPENSPNPGSGPGSGPGGGDNATGGK